VERREGRYSETGLIVAVVRVADSVLNWRNDIMANGFYIGASSLKEYIKCQIEMRPNILKKLPCKLHKWG
jgi:hypothetical protein